MKIMKGLDIPLSGAARAIVSDALEIALYAVKPTDFVGVTPRLVVAEGDKVEAGTPLFLDKGNEWGRFVSPVSGQVKAVVRGDKRALLAVVVERLSNTPVSAAPLQNCSLEGLTRDKTKSILTQTGCWSLFRRRPFGTLPLPSDNPKAIFISCFDSAPAGADYDFMMCHRSEDFHFGLQVLTRLTDGSVHLGFCSQKGSNETDGTSWRQIPDNPQIVVHHFSGPHPAGLVGTQIAAVDPINKGEVVWTIDPQDVANLGHLFRTGTYAFDRMVAFAGPSASVPCYYRLTSGADISQLCALQGLPLSSDALQKHPEGFRIVSGNVLSGTEIYSTAQPNAEQPCFLSASHNLVTAIPEGDYFDFMGWLMPGLRKFSFSRTFLSGFRGRISKCCKNDTPYRIDTNLHGEPRPIVLTGNFDKIFPFKIFPLQLIKAAMIGDIDLMEKLGIYEVEPEDFALCEFIDPSKTEIQTLIRESLEIIRKEGL